MILVLEFELLLYGTLPRPNVITETKGQHDNMH